MFVRGPNKNPAGITGFFLILTLFAPNGSGGWDDHDDVPEWARRGALRWLQASAPDMASARNLVEQGINLVWQSYGTEDPEVIAFLAENGVHRTEYICSTSLFPDRGDPPLFARFPPLRAATVFEHDGTRRIIYNSPWDRDGATKRCAGCRLSPQWLTYQKNRMTLMAQGGQPFPDDPVYQRMERELKQPLHVFFFDNPFNLKCYCQTCQAAWKKACLERFGICIPDPERYPDERVRAAWDYFWLEANAAYFRALKAHAHAMTPPRLIAPNWIHGYPEYYYLMQQVAPDIVLVELGGGGERPWGRSEFSYKLALAATNGKALANIWCFPPARPRLDYRRPPSPLIWSGDLPSGYLTNAEGVACLASYLNGSREELNRFLKRYRRLYTNAQPASEVALVYSISTELWRRRRWNVDPVTFLGPTWWIGMDYTPSAHVKHWADDLSAAGIPYDILVERQLTGSHLRPYRVVILPDVQCLEAEHARALISWVKRGGKLIVLGQLGVRDSEGLKLPRKEAEKRMGPLTTASSITTLSPAEAKLSGFRIEEPYGNLVALPSASGRPAVATWTISEAMLPGPPRQPYSIRVQCLDSSLGEAVLRRCLNGRSDAIWRLDEQSDELVWLEGPEITLREGDTLTIEARPEGGELGRLVEVRIERRADSVSLGRGEMAFLSSGSDRRKPDLGALLGKEARVRQRWSPASAFVNFLHPAGSPALALHIVNFTVEEPYHATILNHPDCRAEKTITLSPQELEEMAEPVVSVLGFTPYWTQTFMAHALGRQPYRPDLGKIYPPLPPEQRKLFVQPDQMVLHVALNGQPAGQVRADEIVEGWTHIPVRKSALKVGPNVVALTVSGDLGHRRSYYGLLIDTSTEDSSSVWTPAPGPDHAPEADGDLSPYRGVQRGSFAFLLRDREGPPPPAYAPSHVPLENVRIELPANWGPTPAVTLLSPDWEEPLVPRLEKTGDRYVITVPRVEVYTVALIASSQAELRELLR